MSSFKKEAIKENIRIADAAIDLYVVKQEFTHYSRKQWHNALQLIAKSHSRHISKGADLNPSQP